MSHLIDQLSAARQSLAALAGRAGFRPSVVVLDMPAGTGGAAQPDPAAVPACTLFFSVTNGQCRARTIHVSADTFVQAWAQGEASVRSLCEQEGWGPGATTWLRVDMVDQVRIMPWQGLQQALLRVKRNYFRHGLAFDPGFRWAFTEQELNANAMLYGGGSKAHAVVNIAHFRRYGRQRHGPEFKLPLTPDTPVYLLGMTGVFCGADGVVHKLIGQGPDVGRREVVLQTGEVRALIESAAGHLVRQVLPSGRFIYGYFPCFDRQIASYNTLRHASTTYAMAEAWGLTRDAALRDAMERALSYLTEGLIERRHLPDGRQAAFVVDTGGEIKLGGNAAAILALVQHAEVTGVNAHAGLMALLAEGIAFMQDRQSGGFSHVLHASDLSIKEQHRIIYYDGEAAFALCRLYAFDGDPRWLQVVERAFEHFIAEQHWRAHDHWLAYAVNELTKYRPEEKYFRFGVQNVAGHLDFVLKRQTTFPTLLELMLAAQRMLDRLQTMPELSHLLDDIDQVKFARALTHRANHLLNGFFWPEMAMFFKRPESISGSFFIRHQSFRVRIDDIEHYLSGYVAYHHWLGHRGVGQVMLAASHDCATAELA